MVRETTACGPVHSLVYDKVLDDGFTEPRTCARVRAKAAPSSANPMSQEIQPTPRAPHRGRRLLIALGGAAVLGALVWMIMPTRPAHDGRTLTSWLEQGMGTTQEEVGTTEEAWHAVCGMKAEKVWPVLLKLIRSTDSRFSTYSRALGNRWNLPILRNLPSAERKRNMAVAGFAALGEKGAPAVPELAAMLEDPALAYSAVRCLGRVGRPAEAALGRALTNTIWMVRYEAVHGLARTFKNFEEMLAHIKSVLSDPARDVRHATVMAIGRHTEAPEAALPLLVAALADPDERVSGGAAQALISFGTSAAIALPALSRVAAEANDRRACSALRAMAAISPPDAWPVLLGHLASAPILRRHTAAVLLGNYERATPEIISALEKVAADPDENFSNTVACSLAKLRHESPPLRLRPRRGVVNPQRGDPDTKSR